MWGCFLATGLGPMVDLDAGTLIGVDWERVGRSGWIPEKRARGIGHSSEPGAKFTVIAYANSNFVD